MKPSLIDIIRLKFVPSSTDAGLLLSRAWLGLGMFGIHGLDKLKNFSGTVTMFQEKMGIPSVFGAAAVLAESVAAILLVVGLATRWSALFLAVTMAVAFFVAHKGVLSGPGSGEVAFLYLGGFLALLVTGPGRYSVDAKLAK